MDVLRRVVFSAIPVVVFLYPVVGMAQEPHSWCVPGAAMINPPPGSTDATTTAVVKGVCGQTEFAGCCNRSGGRWGLSCVQAGMIWARQYSLGDACGRLAWVQGPISGSGEYYPRDFNLVVLSGGASGFQDVHGPIAANGDVTTSSFNLNSTKHESIALIAKGSVSLTNGTVTGAVEYGNSFSSTNVNFVDASRPTAPTSPMPIDFAAVTTKLTDMSKAVALYTATSATKSNNTVTFSGSDAEMNVFTLASSSLTNTTNYQFNVPSGSYVIVNVTGASPVIQNAGFGGAPAASKILWNFPDATSLKIASVGFPGSILAPKAAANFANGSITGSVVVKTVVLSYMAFYWGPFQLPGCTGGLCIDSSWSCSADTVMDDNGWAANIAPEACFMEFAGGAYISESFVRKSPKQRVWYSFQPASSMPKTKPLAVFFNGGPGAGTSAFLFNFNTGPWTLDPQATGSEMIVSNPNSWTKFANLLYIDAPGTGFSYPMALDDGTKPSAGIDIDRDAGTVLRVIARFLVRHPALRNNRVVIVGESYGGTRATLMLNYLYNYASLVDPSSAYRDAGVFIDLFAYFITVFGTSTPTAAQIASKFGHQVLIEPAIAGSQQQAYNTNQDVSVCRSGSYDPYNCDKAPAWSDQLEATAFGNLVHMAVLTKALGVDPKTIAWMAANARTTAYGRASGTIASAPEMVAAFGTLNSQDNYFLAQNNTVLNGYYDTAHGYSRGWYNSGIPLGTNFLTNLSNVTTFITYATYDTVIWSPAIPRVLGDGTFSSLVSSVTYDPNASTGLARSGQFVVTYKGGATRTVVLPKYAAGHTIPMRTPADILTDVMQWYAKNAHAMTHALVAGGAGAEPEIPMVQAPAAEAQPNEPQHFLGP